MVQAVNKLTMTDSQLNMWRAVIAIAHADGTVQQEEKDYLYKTLANIDRSYNLKDAQRMALANDLKTPQDISTLIPLITDPQHRAMLVHFGEVLAWASAGSVGFKGSRKGTPFAAQQASENACRKAMEHGLKRVDVLVRGPGSGRETAIRSLQGVGSRST